MPTTSPTHSGIPSLSQMPSARLPRPKPLVTEPTTSPRKPMSRLLGPEVGGDGVEDLVLRGLEMAHHRPVAVLLAALALDGELHLLRVLDVVRHQARLQQVHVLVARGVGGARHP